MTKPVTVRERVRELVQQHGSYPKAAKAVGVPYRTLWRLGRRDTETPRPKVLLALNLNPDTAMYSRLTS